ncbi:MAG: DUF5677 domain-containing protein [Bryobacteraceae bacterium]
MSFSVEIMNRALYLLRTGVSLSPNAKSAERGVTRNRAIVLGHLVRLMKLFECLLIHTCENRVEICMIFLRLIFETAIRLEYLLNAKRSTFKSFVLTSYRPEKEHLEDLRNKAKQRPLIPIERRIRRSVARCLRRDGISQKNLSQNRTWELDGKNFRMLLKDAGYADWGYSYLFGNGSHFIHGDWRDLSAHHLLRRGRWYEPKPDYKVPDPRVTCCATEICLGVLLRFLRWNRSDPDHFVGPIVEKLRSLNQAMDDAHELYWQHHSSP